MLVHRLQKVGYGHLPTMAEVFLRGLIGFLQSIYLGYPPVSDHGFQRVGFSPQKEDRAQSTCREQEYERDAR